MKPVTAYACGRTGQIFKTAREAARHEFHEMMHAVGGALPTPNANSMHTFYDVFSGLANNLDSATYGDALVRLWAALTFLADNYEVITGKPRPPLTLDEAAVDPGIGAMTRLTIDTDDKKLFEYYRNKVDFSPFRGPMGRDWFVGGWDDLSKSRTRPMRYQIVLAQVIGVNVAERTA